MSLLRTTPTVEHIHLSSPVVEEKSSTRIPAQLRRVLPSKAAIVGNYLPRQCGIATFTTDLCSALSAEYGAVDLLALPVNDTEAGYSYPAQVRFELTEDNLDSYSRAADFLNLGNVDIVCLQHEYGIFGGPAGRHILELLRRLQMPFVTTLHTVLRDPDPDQRLVTEEIAALSDRLIVMSEHSAEILQEVFRVPANKIDLIPHGVPDLPFTDPNFYKDCFGTEGKVVLLTFGLLSPNKGIENVIQALPRILARHSNVVYMVAGATHPQLKRREGEQYRRHLENLAIDLGVQANVIFHNRFVSPQELVELVGSADIYITPYKHKSQVVSGTLAYALSAGKAVISTPYLHALELLDQERGVLVPFDDPGAIAARTMELLDNDTTRHAMRKRAYLYARDMVWKQVANRYMKSFERVYNERLRNPRATFFAQDTKKAIDKLPAVNLDHLNRMTDDTGIVEHAVFVVPNYPEGYTTDDNARALIVSILLEGIGDDASSGTAALASRYLAFLWLAFDPVSKRFRNLLSYDRHWEEAVGSEDSHGRALWGLGTVLGRSKDVGLRGAAGRLFELAVPAALEFRSPRAWAFALLGLEEYLDWFPGDRAAISSADTLANRLFDLYRANNSDGWHWFEAGLAYSNARLPQALLRAGMRSGNKEMISAGLEALDWLSAIQRCKEKGHFVPIGSRGFYSKTTQKARFDQQPVEACAVISSCLQANRATGKSRWLKDAWSAFNWFLGDNDLQIALYDPTTGGCRDGLHPERVNENQGSESTLSFLMALLEMRKWEESILKESVLEEGVNFRPT
ncbi:MAG TPA: glycosyltransferase family 4 protein [Candidatus Dormibacteraeota bacterium]|nr:glycosyltransferase family 4 protein [Candidatus Dormibacteraeota bacterium]